MLVASQVDELRPVDKGVTKPGEMKMPSDREGAKQFVTQELTKLKEKVDEAKTSLSKKSASATGSSGTAATASKSASESKDEQDDEQSAKEKPLEQTKTFTP